MGNIMLTSKVIKLLFLLLFSSFDRGRTKSQEKESETRHTAAKYFLFSLFLFVRAVDRPRGRSFFCSVDRFFSEVIYFCMFFLSI